MNAGDLAALESHYAGRRVLVTGHTGFKGSWLVAWLHRLGAEVSGISLAPEPHQFPLATLVADRVELAAEVIGDITDGVAVASAFEQARPQTVFHLAAQPLVRASYERPVETYAVNVVGTVQVLETARHAGTETIVCVTTDKCYENVEQMWPYRETDPMGGFDPYSASKGAAELAIASYRRSYFGPGSGIGCASARAGNVVGGGDLSPDRLVPDIYRAMVGEHDLV
ncbi:MAG: CDP-glucose 4,6-dehydratase, partial [Ilumatobacteraceae bacterium]